MIKQDKKTDLTVALLQSMIVWEAPEANREHYEALMQQLPKGVAIAVLPEMFTTGFTMAPEAVAEPMDGTTVTWLLHCAKKYQMALTGSVVIQEDALYYNRLLFVTPEGDIQHYDKRHTFTLAGESEVYTAGKQEGFISYKGWKIALRICYDLRFPVWSRNTVNYDVVLYTANWPQPRIHAWDTLLQARAIENMAYCIGVNRVGTDPNGHQYPGHSAVYDPLGHPLCKAQHAETNSLITTLAWGPLQDLKKQLPFLEDRDEFELH